MAVMGLRLAQRANGVSKLHGEVSRGMFGELWPGFDAGGRADHLGDERRARADLGRPDARPTSRRRRSAPGTPRPSTGPATRSRTPTSGRVRRAMREQLVADARRRLIGAWQEQNPGLGVPSWFHEMLDPDILTIGFARRVPTYKRLTLMLHDPERLRVAAAAPGAAGAGGGRRQVASGRRRGQAAHPGARRVRVGAGGARAHRVPAQLRHRHGASGSTRAPTCG